MRRTARVLLVLGALGAVLGLGKLHAAFVADPPYDYTASDRFVWSLVLVGAHVVYAYAVGLPDLVQGRRAVLVASATAALAATFAVSVVQFLVADALLPRFVVFGTAPLMTAWSSFCAELIDAGREREADRDRVVVVGSWADAAGLRSELEAGAERPARIVDVLTVPEARPKGLDDRPLMDAVLIGHANVVVLDRDAQIDEAIVDQVAQLHEAGVRVRTLSLFYEQWLGKLPVAELERVSLMFDIGELHRARFGRIKRMVDVVAAFVLLPVLMLSIPMVWLGNRFANPGPLLFRQERVGRFGAPFTILKFRTMTHEPKAGPSGAGEWTQIDDGRVTPFGRILRRTHLDELPQVLNVLRGDLSIVGPRPEQTAYVRELTGKLPFYRLRHLVRPGITGWAQVKHGYAANEADALEKLQYEFYYLRHQQVSLDLRIVARTLRAVVGRSGA